MSDRIRDGALEGRGMSDGRSDRSAVGRRANRRDDTRAIGAGSRSGDDWGYGFYGDPEAQPDHGEENG